VARTRAKRNLDRFWLEELRERHYLEDLGLVGRLKLKWNLKKNDKISWTDLI